MTEPLHIVVDSREAQPWSWEPCDATTEVAGLVAGDYALLQDTETPKKRGSLRPVRFALERKSADDLAGTLGAGWDRFVREMTRMEAFCARIIIVEADYESFCFREYGGEIHPPTHNHPQMTPAFITHQLSRLSFMNVQIWFAGNAMLASGVALHLFRERRRMLEGL